MRRFENILFVAELGVPAERALHHAVKVARANGAKLSVISVVPSLPWEVKRLLRFLSEEELQQRREQAEYEHLTELRERLRHEGIEVRVRLRAGTPFAEIIREVLLQEHDLLIKAPKVTSAGKHTALGSLDLHLVRKCPCPVWIINPGPRRTFSRILAAVNPHPEEEERNQINKLIMDLATSLAHTENSELYIVTARSVYDEATLRLVRAQLSEKQLKEGMHGITQARDDMLHRLSSHYELDHIATDLQVLPGRPGDAIPALATRKGVDLLIMGSVEQAGQPGVLIGQTAEDILREVHCSVLTVKPLGFVTPVTLDT